MDDGGREESGCMWPCGWYLISILIWIVVAVVAICVWSGGGG